MTIQEAAHMCPSLDLDLCPSRPSHPPERLRCLNPPARLRPRGQLQLALWEPVVKTCHLRFPSPAFHDIRGSILHVRSVKRQDCAAPRGLRMSEWLPFTLTMSPRHVSSCAEALEPASDRAPAADFGLFAALEQDRPAQLRTFGKLCLGCSMGMHDSVSCRELVSFCQRSDLIG